MMIPVSTARAQVDSSFKELARTPGWEITWIHLKSSVQSQDHLFTIQLSQGTTIGFQGQRDGEDSFFGPVQSENIPILNALLDANLEVTGSLRKDIESINFNWELYPEKIARWAKVWQTCPLAQKKWKGQDLSITLELMKIISGEVKKDMSQTVADLGFDLTGISMEKIFHFKAGKLSYYDSHLKPLGIPADFELPIPMMMWLQVKTKESMPASGNHHQTSSSFQVESISATATKKSSKIYFSFDRLLNRYELSGDTAQKDGRFVRLKIMQDKTCRTAAKNLLNAGFAFTNPPEAQPLFLKIDPGLYPGLFNSLIKNKGTIHPFEGSAGFKRPEMPDDMLFYRYTPDSESTFIKALTPFLKNIEYRFSHLELSFQNTMKAKYSKDFQTLLKPAGIGPEEKPWLPYIVYMVLKK